MKFGFASSVKGIRPEARETAREAARRAGLPLNEWLNAIIMQQAAEQGVEASSVASAGERSNHEGLSKVYKRLNDITRRIDQAAHGGPEAYAPKRNHNDPDEIADLMMGLEQRLEKFVQTSRLTPSPVPDVQLPPALEHAVAEITARRRALNGDGTPTLTRATESPSASVAPIPPPAQDLTGLENQLRRITDQIETLRRPGVEEAIHAIRNELAQIGNTLNEAMPRRAIETIEKQIQDLTQRIEEGRQAGADSGALTGIEHGLAEVRDALRGLMPAETLVGYNEAIKALAHKINLIVAQKDPATIQRLESSIAALREMAAHVASNEAVGALAAQLKVLAEKVDQLAMGGGTGGALSNLEHRIDALSRTLAERTHDSETVPRLETLVQSLADKIDHIQQSSNDAPMQGDIILPRLETLLQPLADKIDRIQQSSNDAAMQGDVISPRLETLLQSLADKIDRVEQSSNDAATKGNAVSLHLETLTQSLANNLDRTQSGGEAVALGHLEDRIVKLMERLDASDLQLGHLDAIERRLADLLVHIEDIRTATPALQSDAVPGIDAIKQDIARNQKVVDDINGTLDHVADRLALIEKDIRADRQRPAAPQGEMLELARPAHMDPAGTVTVVPARAPQSAEAPSDMLMSISAALAPMPPPDMSAPASSSKRVLSTKSPSIVSDLLPDQPLEPGSGPPHLSSHPGARIAASEAALGGARPDLTTPAGRSDFIAAARRAAQAAGQDPRSRVPRSDLPKTGNVDRPSLRAKVMTRVKSLFLAASIVAIVIGSIHFAGNVFNFGFFDSNEASPAKTSAIDTPEADIITGTTTEPEVSDVPAGEQTAAPSAANPVPPITAAEAAAIAKLFAPPALPLAPAVPSAGTTASAPPLDVNPNATGVPAPSNLPVTNTPLPEAVPGPKNDVAGSIARAPADAKPSRQAARAAQPMPEAQPPTVSSPGPADRLPAAIGAARLRNAALAGDAGAAYEVAMRFVEGRGVQANLEEGARWFERAAGKGLTPAQFRYASMLEKGQGVKKDLTAAHKLYVAAAGKGHAKAMHNLAVLYAEGAEGKPDFASAAQWFRKAAEHGVADSQYNLGVLAARGLGTERNMAESYKWFALAAVQGDRDAGRKRDEVAAYLDAKTLAAAQQAVKSFVAEGQPPEAISVPEPPGGWDGTSPPAREKPKTATGPLSTDAFNLGKL